MTKKTLVPAIALLAIFAALPSAAIAEEDSPLKEKMEAMGHNLKAIQNQMADPSKKDSTLALIAKMKGNAAAAREYTPPMAKGIPEKDRPQFQKDYKLAMSDLIEQIGSLDKAVRDGKLEDAKTIIKDILESKRDGHSTFMDKKGKGGDDEDEDDD